MACNEFIANKRQYEPEQLQYFVDGFIQAMLFATTNENGSPLDGQFSKADIESNSLDHIIFDCIDFLETAGHFVDSGDLEQHGMDFFFTRNGHGVGFADRDLPREDFDTLIKIAKQFSALDIWDECGEIYVE